MLHFFTSPTHPPPPHWSLYTYLCLYSLYKILKQIDYFIIYGMCDNINPKLFSIMLLFWSLLFLFQTIVYLYVLYVLYYVSMMKKYIKIEIVFCSCFPVGHQKLWVGAAMGRMSTGGVWELSCMTCWQAGWVVMTMALTVYGLRFK